MEWNLIGFSEFFVLVVVLFIREASDRYRVGFIALLETDEPIERTVRLFVRGSRWLAVCTGYIAWRFGYFDDRSIFLALFASVGTFVLFLLFPAMFFGYFRYALGKLPEIRGMWGTLERIREVASRMLWEIRLRYWRGMD